MDEKQNIFERNKTYNFGNLIVRMINTHKT